MPDSPRRVLVADDHEVVRRGVQRILDEQPDLSVAGEAAAAPEVLEKVRNEEWDLVILDLGMPGGEGVETLRRIRSAAPDLPVLVLSIHPEDQLAARMLKAGAQGYLHKDAASEELVRAARQVLDGHKYLSAELSTRLTDALAGDGAWDPHEKLSDRELQVLRQLGAGASVSEIADTLSLSVKTVSTYRSRLLEKLGLETTAELIRYALEHDLVQ